MTDVVKVASYISDRYKLEFGMPIDEMKLHKMLYFAQRESLIVLGEPLFDTSFHAWKYGPVIVEIRTLFKWGGLHEKLSCEEMDLYRDILDKVFVQYARMDSWSLSSISHGELSWQKARYGVPADVNSDAILDLEDIKLDAQRIKTRRFLLSKIKKMGSNA